jgi:hypothetical protein
LFPQPGDGLVALVGGEIADRSTIAHPKASDALFGVDALPFADERLGDLEDGRNGVVGDALLGHGDGQGTFVFAGVAGLVQKLLHGIRHQNLLETG